MKFSDFKIKSNKDTFGLELQCTASFNIDLLTDALSIDNEDLGKEMFEALKTAWAEWKPNEA